MHLVLLFQLLFHSVSEVRVPLLLPHAVFMFYMKYMLQCKRVIQSTHQTSSKSEAEVINPSRVPCGHLSI